MDDDVRNLVIDCGTYLCKAGFAGDDAPTTVFPACVTKENNSISYPVQRGMVTNFLDMEQLLANLFVELKIQPEGHAMLLADCVMTPKVNREKMIQVMMETFNVPAVYFALHPVLSLYESGRTTGLVLESGDGLTQVVPLYEGFSVSHAITRVDIGGTDLTEYLSKIVTEHGYAVATTADRDMVREMKQKVCYAALSYHDELSKVQECTQVDKIFKLPDGTKLTLNKERFHTSEILFQPHIIGKPYNGIHELVHECIGKCDMDIRKDLFSNIILSGGNTLVEGLPTRLHHELVQMVPQSMPIKVVAPQYRKYSAWIGGSIMASLSAYQAFWISKEEYEEYGPQIVHRKCHG